MCLLLIIITIILLVIDTFSQYIYGLCVYLGTPCGVLHILVHSPFIPIPDLPAAVNEDSYVTAETVPMRS
jgi:hypothetical protein